MSTNAENPKMQHGKTRPTKELVIERKKDFAEQIEQVLGLILSTKAPVTINDMQSKRPVATIYESASQKAQQALEEQSKCDQG